MYKLLVVAILMSFLVSCGDKSALEPSASQELAAVSEIPRASDGILPAEYIQMYNLQRLLRDMPEDFNPQDTVFAGDYIYEGGEGGGRVLTIGTTDTLGNKTTVSYCFPFDCGDYLIIYGPTGIGGLRTTLGCEDSPVDGYARYVGGDSLLETYLDSILQH